MIEGDPLTMSAVMKVLFSATAGALIAFVPTFFLASRAEKTGRERELWRRDADLCGQLEQVAGEITDRLSAWGVRPEDYDVIGGKINNMALLSGRFPRYPRIQRSILDLHNTASRMWADRNHYDSNEERKAVTSELRERQAALLAACDEVTGRRRK